MKRYVVMVILALAAVQQILYICQRDQTVLVHVSPAQPAERSLDATVIAISDLEETRQDEGKYWVELEVFSNLSLPSPRPGTLFAAVVGYAGQQGSGALSLSAFQCFLTSLHGKDALIAEPKFKDSAFLTYANSNLSFSSVLDLDHFNKESSRIGYPGMLNLEEFIKQSPILTIYICISGLRGTSRQKVIWQAARTKNSSVKCLQLDDIQNISGQYNLKSFYSKYCVVRVVELWAPHITTWNGKGAHPVNSIHKLVFGEWFPGEVTLIFSYFAFYKHPPLIMPPNAISCTKQTRSQFQPSKRIIQDAQTYKDTFLGGENRLAIMLRVERLKISSHGDDLNTTKKCFDEVFDLKRRLAKDFSPLVTIDVGGKYGTGTSKNDGLKPATEYSKKAFEALYNNTWSVREWEESFIKVAGGVTDRGYIAALQRVLASRADCLVLVGGGDFQAMAVKDYMHYHNSKECIFSVCDKNGHVQEVIDNFRIAFLV